MPSSGCSTARANSIRDMLPLLVGQQQARRVGVAAAAGHPHAAGPQRGAQLVGGAQLIRATVEPAAAGVDDVRPPLRCR